MVKNLQKCFMCKNSRLSACAFSHLNLTPQNTNLHKQTFFVIWKYIILDFQHYSIHLILPENLKLLSSLIWMCVWSPAVLEAHLTLHYGSVEGQMFYCQSKPLGSAGKDIQGPDPAARRSAMTSLNPHMVAAQSSLYCSGGSEHYEACVILHLSWWWQTAVDLWSLEWCSSAFLIALFSLIPVTHHNRPEMDPACLL